MANNKPKKSAANKNKAVKATKTKTVKVEAGAPTSDQ